MSSREAWHKSHRFWRLLCLVYCWVFVKTTPYRQHSTFLMPLAGSLYKSRQLMSRPWHISSIYHFNVYGMTWFGPNKYPSTSNAANFVAFTWMIVVSLKALKWAQKPRLPYFEKKKIRGEGISYSCDCILL